RHEMRPHFEIVWASQVGERYVPASPVALSRRYTLPTLLLAAKICCPCPLTSDVTWDSGSFARNVLCCEPRRTRTRPGSAVRASVQVGARARREAAALELLAVGAAVGLLLGRGPVDDAALPCGGEEIASRRERLGPEIAVLRRIVDLPFGLPRDPVDLSLRE